MFKIIYLFQRKIYFAWSSLSKRKTQTSQINFLNISSIFDVFVDARPSSKNFGQYGFVKLNNPGDSIYIPRGYLHGFCTLEENTTIGYKVDNFYNKDSELNVLWNDRDLKLIGACLIQCP